MDEYFRKKMEREQAEASANCDKESNEYMILSVVSCILATPIFYLVKYIYSLLH
ncbi:MAG: hypothetical protein LBC64_08590 [Fibromonadaceae bacterium]|nr:hypothetical protein [Fibromonadaceae bacterium]